MGHSSGKWTFTGQLSVKINTKWRIATSYEWPLGTEHGSPAM
jgi:hypothetical protein